MRAEDRWSWVGALTGQTAAVGWTLWAALTGRMANGFLGDVRGRYTEIARLARPWVEQPVEFTPLSVAVMEPLGWTNGTAQVAVHLGIQLTLHLAAFAVLALGIAPRAGRRFLWWSLPLLPLLLARVDLVSMLAVAVALALLARGRDLGAGVAVAAGVLAKVWPGLLVVTWWWHRRRASVAAAVATGVAVVAWLALTTPSALRQVLGFRGAVGWHVESVAGSLVRLVDGGEVLVESGAYRFGEASGLVPVALGAVALALGVVVARRVDDPGRQLLTVLALFLVAAPLLSAQYAGWLVVPLAVTTRLEQGERLAAAVTVVASFGILWYLGDVVRGTPFGWTLVLTRNAALVTLAGLLVRTGTRSHTADRPDRRVEGALVSS